jgi:hypothetical protein
VGSTPIHAQKYADAAPLFREALELHHKYQPKRRLVAGDVLAEWSVAALTQSSAELGRAESAKLRKEAIDEYRAALDAPTAASAIHRRRVTDRPSARA